MVKEQIVSIGTLPAGDGPIQLGRGRAYAAKETEAMIVRQFESFAFPGDVTIYRQGGDTVLDHAITGQRLLVIRRGRDFYRIPFDPATDSVEKVMADVKRCADELAAEPTSCDGCGKPRRCAVPFEGGPAEYCICNEPGIA